LASVTEECGKTKGKLIEMGKIYMQNGQKSKTGELRVNTGLFREGGVFKNPVQRGGGKSVVFRPINRPLPVFVSQYFYVL
jgi:hypothetical protein